MKTLSQHQSKAAKAKWRGVTKAKRAEIMRKVIWARWDKVRREKQSQDK